MKWNEIKRSIRSEKKDKKLPCCCQKICFPTPPHLPTPYLDIQIWSTFQYCHYIASSIAEESFSSYNAITKTKNLIDYGAFCFCLQNTSFLCFKSSTTSRKFRNFINAVPFSTIKTFIDISFYITHKQ